jgi:hypothetical protein
MRLRSLSGSSGTEQTGGRKPSRDSDGREPDSWTAAGQRREAAPSESTQSVGVTRDRGQSNIIGAAIIVGTFALLFVTAQVDLAPQVRQTTEFDHARSVLAQMSQVQANTITAASTGSKQATVIEMGGNYPEYLILIQPSGPSGTLTTAEEQAVSVTGATAVDPEVRDVFVGGGFTQTFRTHPLTYSPNYVSYENPPDTTIEHNVLYEDYSGDSAPTDANIEVEANTDVVDGNRINLIASHSDISRGQTGSLVLNQEPLSGGGQPVRIRDQGSHIRIGMETNLPVEEWRRMLASEIEEPPSSPGDSFDGDQKYITAIEPNAAGDGIVIHLEADAQYQLNAGKIGYRASFQAPFEESADPEKHYLDLQSPGEVAVQEGSTTIVTVQSRDKFHNPVSGVELTASASRGTVSPSGIQTRPDGQARLRYEAPEVNGPDEQSDTVTVRFADSTVPADARKKVEVDITVINSDDS